MLPQNSKTVNIHLGMNAISSAVGAAGDIARRIIARQEENLGELSEKSKQMIMDRSVIGVLGELGVKKWADKTFLSSSTTWEEPVQGKSQARSDILIQGIGVEVKSKKRKDSSSDQKWAMTKKDLERISRRSQILLFCLVTVARLPSKLSAETLSDKYIEEYKNSMLRLYKVGIMVEVVSFARPAMLLEGFRKEEKDVDFVWIDNLQKASEFNPSMAMEYLR